MSIAEKIAKMSISCLVDPMLGEGKHNWLILKSAKSVGKMEIRISPPPPQSGPLLLFHMEVRLVGDDNTEAPGSPLLPGLLHLSMQAHQVLKGLGPSQVKNKQICLKYRIQRLKDVCGRTIIAVLEL